MKRFILWGIFLFLFTALSVASTVVTNSSDSNFCDKHRKIMASADSITFMLLDPWVDDTTLKENGYGEVLNRFTTDDKTLLKEAASLLSTLESSGALSMKNCMHMADVVLSFHTKSGDMNVSYSFYCDVVRFSYVGQYVEIDSEKFRLKFLELVKIAYPKDRYIRYLINREKSELK